MTAKMQDLAASRWDDVRIYLAAYRQRSLGAAAARLGVDISTVSRRLTVLEESLGTRLFDRSREGLRPTRAAESALTAAEVMEAAHGRLARDAGDVSAALEGTVRLSADPGTSEMFVVPALARLRQRHPEIEIELDASPRTVDLTRYEADLALRATAPRGADLVVTKIAVASWIVAGAPDLAKAVGNVASWSHLAWITWDRDYASYPAAEWFARHAKGRVALRTSHFGSQIAAAIAGLGVGLFPEPFVRARNLRPLKYARGLAASAASLPKSEVWLVGHRALRDVPRVAAVWEFLATDMRHALAGESRPGP